VGIAAEKVQTFALVKSRDFMLGLVFRLTLHHLHDSGLVVLKCGAVPTKEENESQLMYCMSIPKNFLNFFHHDSGSTFKSIKDPDPKSFIGQS